MWNTKTESKDHIAIDQSVEPLLETWEAAPTTFLQAPPAKAQLSGELPAAFYSILRDLNQSRAVDAIRWRFYLVGFYKLKQELGKSLLRSEARDAFFDRIVSSNMIDDPPDTVKKNCTTWANAGGRYEKIASELGGMGVLILLPEDIPRNM